METEDKEEQLNQSTSTFEPIENDEEEEEEEQMTSESEDDQSDDEDIDNSHDICTPSQNLGLFPWCACC